MTISKHRSFVSCNRDISASLHVFAPLHPAIAILVHPCTSTKDLPLAVFLITSHNDQHLNSQRHILCRPTD